jgi:hypothetical protein
MSGSAKNRRLQNGSLGLSRSRQRVGRDAMTLCVTPRERNHQIIRSSRTHSLLYEAKQPFPWLQVRFACRADVRSLHLSRAHIAEPFTHRMTALPLRDHPAVRNVKFVLYKLPSWVRGCRVIRAQGQTQSLQNEQSGYALLAATAITALPASSPSRCSGCQPRAGARLRRASHLAATSSGGSSWPRPAPGSRQTGSISGGSIRCPCNGADS